MSEHGLSVTQHGDGPAAHEHAQPNRIQPIFHYDLGSPECYLAAERVMAELPVVPEWVPIDAAGLPGQASDPEARRIAVELAAEGAHVQALRWPPDWPGDARVALVAATYAKQIGRAVAFSLAAFRQAFAGGRTLDEPTVLIAAAACEMHPKAVLKALGRASIAAALDAATAEAAAAGVRELPAIRVGAQVFAGPDAIEQATSALAAALAQEPA